MSKIGFVQCPKCAVDTPDGIFCASCGAKLDGKTISPTHDEARVMDAVVLDDDFVADAENTPFPTDLSGAILSEEKPTTDDPKYSHSGLNRIMKKLKQINGDTTINGSSTIPPKPIVLAPNGDEERFSRRFKVLIEFEIELNKRKVSLDSFDASLKAREETVSTSEWNIQLKEEELKDAGKRIKKLDINLTNKAAEIKRENDACRARAEALRNRESSLGPREEAVQRREEDLIKVESDHNLREEDFRSRLSAIDAETQRLALLSAEINGKIINHENAVKEHDVELQSRREELAAEYQSISGREDALRLREEVVARAEADVQNKETELGKREVGFSAREAQSHETEIELAERVNEINLREQAFRDREGEQGSRSSALQALKEEHEKAVKEYEIALQKKRAELMVQAQGVEAVSAILKKREEELTARESAVIDQESRFTAITEEHNMQAEGLSVFEVDLTEKEKRLSVERDEVVAEKQRLTELDKLLTAYDARLQSLARDIETGEARLSLRETSFADREAEVNRKDESFVEREIALGELVLTTDSQKVDLEKREDAVSAFERRLVESEREQTEKQEELDSREESQRKNEADYGIFFAAFQRQVADHGKSVKEHDAEWQKRCEELKRSEDAINSALKAIREREEEATRMADELKTKDEAMRRSQAEALACVENLSRASGVLTENIKSFDQKVALHQQAEDDLIQLKDATDKLKVDQAKVAKDQAEKQAELDRREKAVSKVELRRIEEEKKAAEKATKLAAREAERIVREAAKAAGLPPSVQPTDNESNWQAAVIGLIAVFAVVGFTVWMFIK